MPAHYPQAARYGERLRRLREHRHEGLKEVAKKAGMSFQHLARIEKGEINTPIETLERVAKALGSDLATIVGTHEAREEEDESDVLETLYAQYEALGVTLARLMALPPHSLREWTAWPCPAYDSPMLVAAGGW